MSIHLKLTSDYKSLNRQDIFDFQGNLILISGINGTGKSQLAEALTGHSRQDYNSNIERELTVNDQDVTSEYVLSRSIIDSSNMGDQLLTASQSVQSTKEQVWNFYNTHNLNPFDANSKLYSMSIRKLRAILLESFSEDQLNSSGIQRHELLAAIPADFILRTNNAFDNMAFQTFYAYAKNDEFDAAQRERGNPSLVHSDRLPPWKILNSLFERLGFNYRFREDFELQRSGELNHTVDIYPINSFNEINFDSPRMISSLSDGEKAIISLAFTSINEVDSASVKLLVLDEFDAPLNPSLTKMLYTVLEEFFLAKNIPVILITHSPATIAMAPESTTFYEMFSKDISEATSTNRVQQVNSRDYDEMEIALSNYYEGLSNLSKRAEELNEENERLRNLAQPENNLDKLHILSEGKNILHIRKAVELRRPDLIEKVVFEDEASLPSGSKDLESAFKVNSKITTSTKFIYIWDVDAAKIAKNLSPTQTYFPFAFSENTSNTLARYQNGLPCGIENLYPEAVFTNDVLETIEIYKPFIGAQKIQDFNKTKFTEKIEATKDPEVFANFDPLFVKIDELLQQ